MRGNFFRAVLVSGLLALFALTAAAEDWITQRAWLEDQGGKQTWAQVQNAPFQPYEGVLSKGFGDSAIWVKLKIEAPVNQQQAANLVLRLRPVYLDSVEMFDPAVPGGVAVRTGDVHHPAFQPLRGLDFMVPLAAGPLPRDIWLRVTSSSTRQIHA